MCGSTRRCSRTRCSVSTWESGPGPVCTCASRACAHSFRYARNAMLYAILCYHSEDVVGGWSKEQDDAVLGRLATVRKKLTDEGRLGPVARLMPTTAATTLRKGREHLVIDGPFAETKE